MTRLILDNLEDDVWNELRALARAHGRSVEEEARAILRAATLSTWPDAIGLGTRLANRFRDDGLTDEIDEVREQRSAASDVQE